MAKKKDTPKTNTSDDRTPANKILTDFLTDNNIVLVVDETLEAQNRIPDLLYTVNKVPRLQAYYKDQLNKEKQEPSNSQVDIAN